MTNKFIEFIRQILIRTILPLRRKKEQFLSNFRFSISFRISLSYIKLLIINGAVLFVLFTFLFLGMQNYRFRDTAKDLVRKMEDGTLALYTDEDIDKLGLAVYEYTEKENLKSYKPITREDLMDSIKQVVYHSSVNPYLDEGLSFTVKNMDTGELIYDDTTYDINNQKPIFSSIYYNKENREHELLIKYVLEYTKDEVPYAVSFQFDLTGSDNLLRSLLPGMLIIYLLISFLIIRSGNKSVIKMLEPVNSMSASANRLTVNNLNSERLNIEGTKNELKDLAATFNNMLDRLETSYESQKQFVSDASHELRTPIAVIQGYANLLDRWGKKDELILEESIDAIRNEAKSMQDLVEKLLFLSRHDKRTLKLQKTVFNMREVVQDMVKETKLVVSNRVIGSNALEDVHVYGDKQALKQAVRVFIDNAVKYSKDGDSITISCENHEGDCVITVEDTGIGMTKKDIDNIFERFYRSDQVRDEKINGHGLGLSIAKLIILKHTGKIKIRTQYTKGSSFIITLPNRGHVFK